MTIKLIVAVVLFTQLHLSHSTEIKKWIDQNGKIHYGDISTQSQNVQILDINNPAPEITEGEQLMRMKNDLYFKQLEIQNKEKQLKWANSRQSNQDRLQKQRQLQQVSLDKDRRACLKAKLKIADVEDDLRDGYTTRQGIRLEKKRRKLQRRIDAYC